MNNDKDVVSSSDLSDLETTETEILEEESEDISEEESEDISEQESEDISEQESEDISEDIEIDYTYPIDRFEGSYAFQTTELANDSIDYSCYFENLQTITILILGCLVAIGCILAWTGAKRE